ncbi:MAG: hypothetical protein PHI63_05795 [Patescibacteria group bacterium]|nr:hypothetical protein [Patescibacteria group bacterium]
MQKPDYPKGEPVPSENHGAVLASWDFPLLESRQRGRRWFITMGIIGTLMAIYGIWTGNLLFVLLLVLFTMTYLLMQRQPTQVRFTISEDGISMGRTFYPYRELKKFWIIYQPPDVKALYLEFQNPLKPYFPIPLVDQNPVTIRHALLDYVMEDLHRTEEPTLDQLSRFLKL